MMFIVLQIAQSCVYGPVYTCCTLTGVKLNNNWFQYSRPEIFWQCNLGIEPELQ